MKSLPLDLLGNTDQSMSNDSVTKARIRASTGEALGDSG